MRPRSDLVLYCLVLVFSNLFHLNSQAQTASDPSQFSDADDLEELFDLRSFGLSCKRATKSQRAVVDKGNQLAQDFLAGCLKATGSQYWCEQVMRPNPDSLSIFQCTYGENQVHQLINPDKRTWPNAYRAVRLVNALQAEGIKPCLIYNWWRPEPYNQNVGGVPGRHPKGTSVDVRFCSMPEMESAFLKLCSWRANGQLRALGYYGTTGLHLGIADKLANTWGKSCP